MRFKWLNFEFTIFLLGDLSFYVGRRVLNKYFGEKKKVNKDTLQGVCKSLQRYFNRNFHTDLLM